MILANPQSYITAETFQNMATDYDLTPYTQSQLSDLLVRASAIVDSMMKKSYLAREETLLFRGDGSNEMDLGRKPLIYLKKAELVIPGVVGWTLALDQILIDYQLGSMKIFQPLLWSGSYYALFPAGAPIEVTFAWGYNFAVAPPACTFADQGGGALAPGSYDVAVTSKTQFGESTATVQTVASSQGCIVATVTPVLGATLYRAFAAPHGSPLKFVNESSHTTYGSSVIQIPISSMIAPIGYWPDSFPAVDSSANPVPHELAEATRLVSLSMLYEQNNLANRGISGTHSGAKAVTWRSTTGTSDKGTPSMLDQARDVLAGFRTLVVL